MSEFTVLLTRDPDKRQNLAPWGNTGPAGAFQANPHAATVVTQSLLLSADLTSRHNGATYLEDSDRPTARSLVISFGWSYRTGSQVNELSESDMLAFLHSHRVGAVPDVAVLSGIFCIVSFDHISETLWVCTDMWAQHGYYYGSNADIIVVSSRASVVADLLKAPIDGMSYLALLRGTGIPPGRTLYSNVWRATCGRAVHLDGRRRTARLVQVQPLYQPPLAVSFAAALDEVTDVVSTVCPFAASRPSTVVDLTGGNDSRLMAAALASAGGSRVADQVTFKVVGDETHPDVVIAGQIAAMFGWSLQRNARPSDAGHSLDSLSGAAVLGDGFQPPLAVAKRLKQETQHWQSFDAHVGSIGGELFRDFFWRQELQNVGRTNRVNFDALLRHRLYAAANVDPGRLSEGRISLADHNAALLEPYRLVVGSLPEMLNVYALDIIYLHKLMATSYCWILSDLRKVILPFLSAAITRVSLRMPWKFRARRRLMTAAVRRLHPALAALPTDAGAPMTPLGLSTALAYGKYAFRDARSAYARHFKRKKPQQQTSKSIPRDWLDFVTEDDGGGHPYDTRLFLSQVRASRDGSVSVEAYREIQALMQVRMLTRHYKGISRVLAFDGKDANFGESIWSL